MLRRSLALAFLALVSVAAGSGAQSLVGTYTAPNQQGGTITLEFKALAGGKVGGTLSGNGNSFQLDGAMNGAMAEGTITGNGMKMFFGAQLNGDQLQFIMVEPDANGQPNFQRATPIQFKRGPAAPPAQAGNPLAAGGGGNPLAKSAAPGTGSAPPGAGMMGTSPQDEQMIRLLTANAWCSFSYSGSSGTYSSGGVSRSSKVYLRPDGVVSATSSSERTSSGASGQAYVGGNDATQGHWKFENGQFYLGQTREQLAPQTFKMTYNSNGYPIPVVNGTEYMICR